MAGAAGALTEPEVLAHAKRRLFPEDDPSAGYAVADTQFAADRWLADQPIEDRIREALAPFNHVRVGSGYPDLVGVRALPNDLLAVDRLGDDPPLVAVEAKGYAGSGQVDVEIGITQAHDRLGEANAAYVAAPEPAVSGSARALARELNVGVLAVSDAGAVEPVERPRVVGSRTTTETTAIRFQASAQGVAEQSFGLNHPKNYLAVPLAVHHTGDTDALIEGKVVGAVDAARQGAAFLGLIKDDPGGPRLTELGREVVRFALREYGAVDAALDAFEGWKGSRKRFRDLAPRWGSLARRVVFAYPATELLVAEVEHMHEDGIAEPTLIDLVEYLHALHPTFTVELFLRGDESVRRRALSPEGDLRVGALADGEVYHAPTVFQLKAILFHAGVLTERGAEPARLDPEADVWALREPLA
ncbi:MAG: hypothetical protein ABEH66_05420 [Halobacteriales archaeon]